MLLVATGSWHIDVHYCHDEVAEISLSNHDVSCGATENTKSTCGTCCSTVELEFDKADDFTSFEKNEEVNKAFKSFFVSNHFPVVTVSNFEKTSNIVFQCGANAPPLSGKIYVNNCALIFYG